MIKVVQHDTDRGPAATKSRDRLCSLAAQLLAGFGNSSFLSATVAVMLELKINVSSLLGSKVYHEFPLVLDPSRLAEATELEDLLF